MKRYLVSGGVAAVLLLGGCSNVHVRKVSVEDRASGLDRHVEGFRYYLTRPYILVKRAVPVGSDTQAVKLFAVKDAKGNVEKYVLVSVGIDPHTKKPRYYEMNGDENPELEKRALEPAKVKARSPAKPKDKPGKEEPVVLTALQPQVNPFGMGPGTQLVRGPVVAANPAVPGALATTVDTTNLPFDVVDLPDFEEQYAINNVNVVAHTQYGYQFTDGCKLAMASGSYNSTQVPVAILNTVGNLISALGEVRSRALGGAGGGGGGAPAMIDTTDPSILYIRRETYIEPGLYRVQKSWERVAGEAGAGVEPDKCLGLLTELGLSVGHCTTVLTAAQYDQLLSGGQAGGAGGGGGGGS